MRVNVGTSQPSLCAEWPNDNPALHGGATWICLATTGPASAIAPERVVALDAGERETVPVALESGVIAASMREAEPEPDTSLEALAAAVGVVLEGDDDEELIVVEELPPLDDAVEIEGPGIAKTSGMRPAAPTETIAPPRGDDAWTMFVSALADVAIGVGSPHAASLVTGLLVHADTDSLPADLAPALAEANVMRDGAVTAAFAAKVDAWRGIVRGTSEDFSACGDAMLDEWAADLLARLVGGGARAQALKRELRGRGVAAFGFAAAA